jgi:hypothetical protein
MPTGLTEENIKESCCCVNRSDVIANVTLLDRIKTVVLRQLLLR